MDVDERTHVQVVGVSDAGPTEPPFPWARLGTAALLRYAPGWTPAGAWTADDRRFAALRSAAEPADGREAR